jgi:hypothetical protein
MTIFFVVLLEFIYISCLGFGLNFIFISNTTFWSSKFDLQANLIHFCGLILF